MKKAPKGRPSNRGDQPKAAKKEPSLEVIKLQPAQHHEKSHTTAAERHRAQLGKTPPAGAFAGYAESKGLSQDETQPAKKGPAQPSADNKQDTTFTGMADGNKEESGSTDAQESREQTPSQETASQPGEDSQAAAERKQKIKRLAANALQAVKGRGSSAALSVRNTVNKGLQSRPVRAIKSNPVRAGLIAAGITGLVAAGVFGTRAVKQKRAKVSGTKKTKSSRSSKNKR